MMLFLFNQLYIDGTIYQSEWIKGNRKKGLVTENSTVIINAPINNFYKKQLKPF